MQNISTVVFKIILGGQSYGTETLPQIHIQATF